MEKISRRKTIVILGPTSSGKSDVAIRLAKKFNGEIISADSRQIYNDMNLGTGKVEGTWRRTGSTYIKNKKFDKTFISERIPHHLIDIVSPKTEYNVSDFQKDCKKLMGEISFRGKLPIICGGTGFWISSVVDNKVLPKVKPDNKLRKKLSNKSAEDLYAQLEKMDPDRAKTIDKNNKVRLIRAIEICKALGKVPKMRDEGCEMRSESFLQIGIDLDKNELEKKIGKRLESRFDAGMIEEVEKLKNKHNLSWKKIQSFGLAYCWIPLFLQGKISEKEMKYRTLLAERNYAKRQQTWFKRDKRIIWEDNYRKIENTVFNFL